MSRTETQQKQTDAIRGMAQEIRDKGFYMTIPEHDLEHEEAYRAELILRQRDVKGYPMGIRPGEYSPQEIADALQFIADMYE